MNGLGQVPRPKHVRFTLGQVDCRHDQAGEFDILQRLFAKSLGERFLQCSWQESSTKRSRKLASGTLFEKIIADRKKEPIDSFRFVLGARRENSSAIADVKVMHFCGWHSGRQARRNNGTGGGARDQVKRFRNGTT